MYVTTIPEVDIWKNGVTEREVLKETRLEIGVVSDSGYVDIDDRDMYNN